MVSKILYLSGYDPDEILNSTKIEKLKERITKILKKMGEISNEFKIYVEENKGLERFEYLINLKSSDISQLKINDNSSNNLLN